MSWSDILHVIGDNHRRDKMTIAMDAALRITRTALMNGMDVVVDECNLYGPQWQLFLVCAQQCKCKTQWQTMRVDPEECKKRDALKEHPVGAMTIDRLAEKYADWLKKR